MTSAIYYYRKPISFILCLSLLCLPGFSQVIKGRVTDARTGEPLTGATVYVEGTRRLSAVRLDGTYSFDKLPEGTYKVKVSYEGYNGAANDTTITVGSHSVKTVNFSLKPEAVELSSVTVSAGAANGERGAMRLEKIADPIVNVMSAKTIQLLPDITVANALQRVSGVTIERSSSGEGRYPIIRGMEKRYINTLVNGIKIPSPDNKNRYIPLDLFSSELLERLEVSKSLTPSMEGDAIGGTINLVMKDAPARLLLQGNVSMGYSAILSEQPYQKFYKMGISLKSPNEIQGSSNYTSVPSDFTVNHLNYHTKKHPLNTTGGLIIGNRFGKNKQFGFVVSGSIQDIFHGTNSTFFLPNAQPGLNNVPQFVELQARKYSTESLRSGITGKLDYQLNKNNKISLVNTFVRLDDYQSRYISDTIALNSLVDEKYRSTWQYQTIYNATLQGNHHLSPSLGLDWSLVYSIADNHIPDQSEFTHEHPVVITPIAGDNLQGISHTWSHNSDKDYAAYMNLSKNTHILRRTIELKAGGMIRSKTRDNFYNTYSLKPQLSSGSSNQPYTDINSAVWVFNPVSAGLPTANGNNYTFDEAVSAGYIQGKWQLSQKLEALGGVRVEYTLQHYNTQLGPEVDARSGTISYTDVLPSLQFKYALTPTQNLRLAYYKALARPGFAELIPAGPDNYETFPEKGNPQGLNHTTANNIDLRYELFPRKADQLLLGVFYKNIQDPIEYSAIKTGVTSLTLEPSNFGNGYNYGAEAVFTRYWGVFGVSLNYTYTQSRITTTKLYSYRNDSGIITSRLQPETRPLQGQSKHIGNISLLYKNPAIGLDIQTAFVYTGERVSLVNPYYGLDYWQAPTTQLDMSFEKRIVKRLSVYGKVNNLTNSALKLELHQSYNTYLAASGSKPLALQTDVDKRITVQKDYFKTAYLLGIRFKL